MKQTIIIVLTIAGVAAIVYVTGRRQSARGICH